jgi:hypothetical protein
MSKPFEVANPLVIMFDQNGKTVTHIYPSPVAPSHEHYGILIADLVRHVAEAFEVEENRVWEWVDKERNRPTDVIQVLSREEN